MPSFTYNHTRRAFIKQCSCCKEVTRGTTNREESIAIFEKVFMSSGPSSGAADGMQSRCWFCNNSKRRYLGITREWLEQTHKDQNGQCAICQKEISIRKDTSADRHAHVDHDENTGKIRELLCGNCNRGIGLFKHDPQLLIKASEYVKKHEVIVLLKRRVV